MLFIFVLCAGSNDYHKQSATKKHKLATNMSDEPSSPASRALLKKIQSVFDQIKNINKYGPKFPLRKGTMKAFHFISIHSLHFSLLKGRLTMNISDVQHAITPAFLSLYSPHVKVIFMNCKTARRWRVGEWIEQLLVLNYDMSEKFLDCTFSFPIQMNHFSFSVGVNFGGILKCCLFPPICL